MADQNNHDNSYKSSADSHNLKKNNSSVTTRSNSQSTPPDSGSLYERLFNETPEAYLCLDEKGIIIQCNKKAELLFGKTKKELIGTVLSDYLTGDKSGAEHLFHQIQKADRECPGTQTDARIRDSRGIIREIGMTVASSINHTTSSTDILVLLRDISDTRRNESKICQQESYYTTILDNLPIGVAVNSVNPSVTFEYINDNFSRFYRVNKDDLQNPDLFWDMVYEDPVFREEMKSRVLEDCASGDAKRMFWTDIPITRDGEEKSYISARNIPLLECGLMISTVWDVTDRIIAEEKNIEQKMFLDRLLETIPSPILYKDISERYLGCNSAFERYIGISKDKIIGKTAFDIAPRNLALIYHEKDQELLKNPGRQNYEAKVQYADQTLHDVIFNKATTTDAQGTVDGIVGVMLDITTLKEAEYNLKKAKQFIEGMLDGIQDIVGLQNPDHTIIRYNKAGYEALGKTYKEVRGKKCYELIGRDEPCEPCATSRAIHTKTKQTIERFIPEFSKFFECTSTPILNDAGEADLIVELLHDITERKIAENALIQVNRQLNLLSAITRHDILNSINAIEIFLDLIKSKIDTGAIHEEICGVETAVSKIQSQIEFTKIYQYLGTHKPQWQRINLLLSHLQIPDYLTFQISGDKISVFADPLLKKVFENLLDNSIRHGMTVSTIRVIIRSENQNVIIIWEDDGIGISLGEKEKIFDRGYGKNTGLGLFFIREILSITGISIKETGEEGKGAHFEIIIPSGIFRADESSVSMNQVP